MSHFIIDRVSRPIVVLLTLSKEESRSAIGQHFTRMSEVKDLKSIDLSVCFLGRDSRYRLLLNIEAMRSLNVKYIINCSGQDNVYRNVEPGVVSYGIGVCVFACTCEGSRRFQHFA